MTRPHASRAVMACLVIVVAALLAPTGAPAHGGGAMAASAEAEIKQLASQPARVLAQQALAVLQVRNDAREAGVRLDAALRSKDRSDIDFARLRRATETLDAGNPAAAIKLLDVALSRPLGADRGKALHEAGREFTPQTGPQEIVGTILGGVLVLWGALGLWRGRGTAVQS